MREYNLPKSGKTARVALLETSDIHAVFDLEMHARAHTPSDQNSETLLHGTAYFQNMLARHTGLMIGISVDTQLIAQIGLRGPSELREAIALKVISECEVPYAHAALTDTVISLNHMAIHQDFKDEGLSETLISFAASLPLSQVVDHVFTQIPAHNTEALISYMAQGFAIVAAAHSLGDKMPRFILQKPAFGFDFSPEVIADDVDPLEDFSAIVNLTQRDALVGIREENSATKLAFFRSRDVLNIMPTIAKVHSKK